MNDGSRDLSTPILYVIKDSKGGRIAKNPKFALINQAMKEFGGNLKSDPSEVIRNLINKRRTIEAILLNKQIKDKLDLGHLPDHVTDSVIQNFPNLTSLKLSLNARITDVCIGQLRQKNPAIVIKGR